MTDPVQLSSSAVDRPSTSLTRTKHVAEQLEASFLAEMLKFGGLDPKSDSFVASTGESQFASFHREALAQEMVKATLDQSTRIIQQLDLILEEERDALLRGDLSQIVALMLKKEQLVDALNALSATASGDLIAVQGKLSRNQALLDGALQGIRTVAARLAAHRRIRRSLDTYDQNGHKRSIPGDIAHHLEKRA